MFEMWGLVFRPFRCAGGGVGLTNEVVLPHFIPRSLAHPSNDNLADVA